MPTIFTIEFLRRIEGGGAPAVMGGVVTGGAHGQLQPAITRAMNLARPCGADGFQIRENGGGVLHTTWLH